MHAVADEASLVGTRESVAIEKMWEWEVLRKRCRQRAVRRVRPPMDAPQLMHMQWPIQAQTIHERTFAQSWKNGLRQVPPRATSIIRYIHHSSLVHQPSSLHFEILNARLASSREIVHVEVHICLISVEVHIKVAAQCEKIRGSEINLQLRKQRGHVESRIHPPTVHRDTDITRFKGA